MTPGSRRHRGDPRQLHHVRGHDPLASLGPSNQLGGRPWNELARFPIFPGTTLGSTPIVVPESWVAYGDGRLLSKRSIDPTLRGRLNPDTDEADAKLVEAIRRALLVLWMTRRTEAGSHEYKPGSWLHAARTLLRLAEWAVDAPQRRKGMLFGRLSRENIRSMVVSCGGQSDELIARAARVTRFLTDAGERGMLSDYPMPVVRTQDDKSETDEVSRRDAEAEHILAGGNVRWAELAEEERTGKPLPDEFVTALIGGAIWVQHNLADAILDVFQELGDIKRETLGAEPRKRGFSKERHKNDYAHYKQFKALREHRWLFPGGGEISRAHVEAAFGGPIAAEWPPRGTRALITWITILQGLNMQIIALCTGARGSEVGAATTGAAAGGDRPRFESLTFKTVKTIGGEMRDWPLHPVGVEAVRIQCRLAELFREPGAEHLWVTVLQINGVKGKPLLDLSGTAVRTVGFLGLDRFDLRDPDDAFAEDEENKGRGKRANLHRWRHTVARLVALSIVEAPQVLLRLFGHESLEMTLRYMLSSPTLAEEAKRVAEEAALVLMEKALEETSRGETSGPAAERLAAALKDYGREGDPFALDGGEDAEPDLRETAKGMKANRRPWSVVRPGVYCTKTWNEFGPCTQGWRAPDVGACRTRCTHRLETSEARDSCRTKINGHLAELAVVLEDGAVMRAVSLKREIKALLDCWPAIREETLKGSALARDIWGPSHGGQ